jgi:small subunit ribosomal protein S5
MLRQTFRAFAKFKPDFTAADHLSSEGPERVLKYKPSKPFVQQERLDKLQKMVKMHAVSPGLSIPDSLLQLAKKDEEFASFLESFNTKVEPEYSSLLPKITEAEHLEADLKRSSQDRLHELHMYEHYRKAKIVTQVRKKLMDEAKDLHTEDQFEELTGKRIFPKALFDRDNFEMLLLTVGTTTNITRLNRVMKRRCLVFTGNYEGIIGYGLGKGVDYKQAYESAIRECLNNLIAIPVDQMKTNLVRLFGRHNGVTLNIDPAPKGYLFGNPIVVSMIELAGIPDCRFGLKGRNRNTYSILYAFFQAVTQNLTMQQVAELSGRKVYELTYGGPLRAGEVSRNSVLY